MSASFFEQIDLFGIEMGAEGRQDVHRIPSLVVSAQGTVLAFCNRRIGSAADHGCDHHLVLRRSLDDGKTWEPVQVLFDRPGWRAGIGNAIVDYQHGTIMLIYGREQTVEGITEKELVERTRVPPAHPDAGLFILRSTDEGATWQESRLDLSPNAWGLRGSTHGSGPGIQLRYSPYAGRLVMPARAWAQPIFDLRRFTHNCVIYSDDGGLTWQTGGLVQAGTGEGCLVETVGGALYLNSRTYHRTGWRMTAQSTDGGQTFTQFGWDQTLSDPQPSGCNASIIRYGDALTDQRPCVLFANPASTKREGMTLRASYDECQSWPVRRVIHTGPAAYSSLGVTPQGTILCFYERGDQNPYEKMTVARFNLAWVESN
ncbi:MAG TPA: sialidase family protein [Caldilineaceae bacterium]|nr:sialidase family protein [Caldilineaceae bacterium]